MIWLTTCATCQQELRIDAPDAARHHPTCAAPLPRQAEHLAALWMQAVIDGNAEAEADLAARIDVIDNQPPRLLEAALVYAGWGWPVFPLHGKRPATRNGFKNATTDPQQIRSWWKELPEANIGLPTGKLFDVVDIDPPDGMKFLHKLLKISDSEPCQGLAVTQRGGVHIYGKPLGPNNGAGRKKGVDYRSVGGYVVAPPSRLDGVRWRSWSWLMPPSPNIKAPRA